MAKNQSTETVSANRGKQVSATIPVALYEALDDHRWDVRLTLTELIKLAVEEYAERNGIAVAVEEDAPAEA